VSGVDVAQQTAIRLEDGEEERQVHAAGRVQLAIETVRELSQVGLVGEPRAERRLDVRHEQRSADAFSGDVADKQRQSSIGQHEIVEEVTADLPGRNRDAGDFRRTGGQRAARQHLGLDQPRELELPPHPLLIDGSRLVALEILRHLIEGACERAEFVRRTHGHARAEIAAGELTHAAREGRQMLRHPMGNRNDADERERDDEHAEPEIADRRAPDHAEGLADRARNPEDDPSGGAAGHDDPVAAPARRSLGGHERRPLHA
jgi:hypothetical protein